MCRKVAEKCRKVPNTAQYWAQFGKTLIKFGVCYLLIQLDILWQSRNPGAHAKLFGCPLKGCSPKLFPKNAEKCRIVPKSVEKCRKVPNIGHNSAIWCRIVPKRLPNILPNCAQYLPKIPKSKIVQNSILGIHLAFLLFSRLPAFSLSRFLAFSLSGFPAFTLSGWPRGGLLNKTEQNINTVGVNTHPNI